METFGIMGFTFGMTAMSFAIIGWTQIANLKKEVNDLKQQLQDNGTIPLILEDS